MADLTFEEAAAWADGVLALAGHELVDPELREISQRSFEGEISSDQAIELMKKHVLGADVAG